MSKLMIRIGASAQEIDQDILAQLHTAMTLINAVETVQPVRSYDFADWNVFFKTMTPNRITILEYIAEHGGVASTRALAAALNRDYRAVHADVAGLVHLGLIHKDGNVLRCESPAEATLVPA